MVPQVLNETVGVFDKQAGPPVCGNFNVMDPFSPVSLDTVE